MKIFLDTSALIAYYNVDDVHHGEASRVFERIRRGEIPFTEFFVTDFVFDETVTFMECVLNEHELAVSVGEALLTSPFTTVLRTDEKLFHEVWDFFKENTGYSFTDCSSFSAMREHGITHAFTFDKHFKDAGFQTIP